MLPENPQDKGGRYGRENRNPGKNQILRKFSFGDTYERRMGGLNCSTKQGDVQKRKKKEHINAAVYLKPPEVFQVPCFLLPPSYQIRAK